jgi:hypothetical protein
MTTLTKRSGLVFLDSLLLGALVVPAVQAQIPANWYDPFGTARRAAYNIALYGRAMSQVPPYALGYNPYPAYYPTPYYPPYMAAVAAPYYGAGGGTIVNNPYSASPGYTSPGMTAPVTAPYGGGYANPYSPSWDPDSGYLRGAADVMGAEGQFRLQNEQARQIREQTRQAAIDTRRRAFDEWLYERANTPTPQEDRERLDKASLRYHLTNPTLPEIYNGTSLNALLDQLQQMQSKGMRGPTIPLDEELLKQINVNPGTGGNVGLLKNVGPLTWPKALSGTDFEVERNNLERNLAEAKSEVTKHGTVDRGRLKDMVADVEKMSERLAQGIGDITPSPYIEARRYLNLLNDALRALQNPDAVNYFTGKYEARGKSVGELVKNMTGLKFAQAAPGEEKAYQELYQGLKAYYNGAQQGSRE